MMQPDPDATSFDALLDLQRGELEGPQREALLLQLQQDEALAADHAALSEALSALERLRPVLIPAGLAERVMQHVRGADDALQPLRLSVENSNRPTFILQSMREIIAVAAMVVLAIGVGVPGLLHVQDRNQRLLCANNLAQIGRGMHAYAAVFGDALPFVGWSGRSTWQASSDPNLTTQPNHSHMFPLVQARLVAPGAFVCAGAGGVPLSESAAIGLSAFPDAQNVSYAYQNMAGVRPSLRDDADAPILADDNPLFDNGMLLIDVRQLAFDAAQRNSRSHGGRGQNLLTIDGRSIWTGTPLGGIHGDNIWTLWQTSDYTGREGPAAVSDAHLLK